MNVRLGFAAVLLAPLLLISAGCKSTEPRTEATARAKDKSADSDLTKAEALSRSARLSEVTYKIAVKLDEKSSDFSGRVEIGFKLKDNASPLRLDFYEGQVRELMVNGQAVPLTAKKQFWIDLPAKSLKVGANQVTVAYTHAYARDGQGLHRFEDPETKEIFLYTQFETFDANRFMPCFDQPDLRATFEMSVEAPAKWEVVSAARESRKRTLSGGRREWFFPAIQPIATYLFSLHAGPYKVWTDKFENIPLRIFARPSMAKYVRVKEWFTYTKQGLKFFNSYYGMPYPFKKYDQLAVPEFNAGAMENVAAVTFTEGFLWRATPTRPQLRRFANVILHEMAHMWFGDIVTMKWWNDLWLNESFATYMASLAQAEGTEFKEAWQEFFMGAKGSAYWEDSLSTTHPIEAPVDSVKDAFATFDGITYGKGASVLKQLSAYIGPQAFQKGIRDYLTTHAYGNTELKDFIAALQKQTNLNLTEWSALWLKQSGVDKVASVWKCDGDKLSKVELVVTPSAGARFRPQSVKLGLFTGGVEGKPYGDPVVVPVTLKQARTVVEGSWTCPTFVFPNYGDDGYMSVSLDAKTLQTATASLSRVRDPLLRSMVWDDLWKMVRFTEMPLRDYVKVVDAHFAPEQDPMILESIVNTVSGRWDEYGTILYFWPQKDQRQLDERMAFIARIEKEYLQRFQTAKPGSDAQKQWFDYYVAVARTPAALDQLANWISQRPPVEKAAMNRKSKTAVADVAEGMPLDVDRHWTVVRRLMRFQHSKAMESYNELRILDTSDRGQKNALASEAIQPELKIKEKWVAALTKPKPEISFPDARAVLGALFPVEQTSLARRFEKDFYSYLKANAQSENENYASRVISGLSPLGCSPAESAKLRGFMSGGMSMSPTISRRLRIGLEEDERCQRVRAMSSL